MRDPLFSMKPHGIMVFALCGFSRGRSPEDCGLRLGSYSALSAVRACCWPMNATVIKPSLGLQSLLFVQRVLETVRQFRPPAASRRDVLVVPAPPLIDFNSFTHTPDHLSARCELHHEDCLLTSIPVIEDYTHEVSESFFAAKARLFPHSWNAVRADHNLPEDSIIGEPRRLLVRCCPRCRTVARDFLAFKPEPTAVSCRPLQD